MFEKHQIQLHQLPEVAAGLLETFPGQRVFAFYGSMGAGKTTFIQAICHRLGTADTVTSPTFALINEYSLPDGDSVFHFDFYRIKNLEEAFDLGYEDYFFSGKYCLVEWPEKVEPLLPENLVTVAITVADDGTRSIRAHTA